MLDLSKSLLAVMVIALAAFGIGRSLLRTLKWPDDDVLDIAVWSLAIGLLAGGAGMLCLALSGWLSENAVLLLSLGGVLAGFVELACLAAGSRHSSPSRARWFAGPVSPKDHRDARLAAVIGTAVLGATFVRALAPPLDPDVLARSLAVPKEVLLSHGGRLSETVLPNLSQFWSLWALALDGPVAANLLHWGLGVLTVLAIVLLARPVLGRRLGWIAGGAAMLVPAVQRELGVPLEGISLAFLAAMALAAAQRSLMEFEQRRAALATGLMAGAAAAIDPAGLLFATALLVAAAHAISGKRPVAVETRGEFLRMLLAMLAVVVPWAARGDLMAPEVGRSTSLASLGPVFAIAAGGLIFSRRLRGLPWLLFVMLVYIVGALVLGPRGAAWAPLVPLGGVLVAWTWHEMQRLPTGLRNSVAGLALALVVVDLAQLVRTVAPCLGVALGWQTREAFLLDHEGSYRAAVLLSAISNPGQRLLLEDANGLYFPCSTRKLDLAVNGAEPESRERVLLEEAYRAGASFVLLAEPAPTTDKVHPAGDSTVILANPSPAESEIFAPSREVIPILEYRFADDNNRCIRYRLWKLQGPPAGPDSLPPVAPAAGGRRIGQLPRPATR
jgi:hypothetical protein